MALTRLVPMLHVSDIRRSLGFYPDDVVGLHRDLASHGVNVGSLRVTPTREE
jgi:hypothetical protein